MQIQILNNTCPCIWVFYWNDLHFGLPLKLLKKLHSGSILENTVPIQ